jgi:hypothetical protein
MVERVAGNPHPGGILCDLFAEPGKEKWCFSENLEEFVKIL